MERPALSGLSPELVYQFLSHTTLHTPTSSPSCLDQYPKGKQISIYSLRNTVDKRETALIIKKTIFRKPFSTMKQTFDQEEVEILRALLSRLKVRKRTGELGIHHGADRFVGTGMSLRKKELDIADKIASKVGLTSGLNRVDC